MALLSRLPLDLDRSVPDWGPSRQIATLTWAGRRVGDGFGHTWPGGPLAIVPLAWLARIDYVLHSPHWRAEAAWLGPWDGQADHRAVAARLSLTAGA